MTLETKIRDEASAKIRVRITSKKRSKRGFNVTFAKVADKVTTPTNAGYRYLAANKTEAMQHLYAMLRCMTPIEISITPAK